MRLTRPSWYQWLTAIETSIETAVNKAGIKSTTMMGADSNLIVKAGAETPSTKMPYCKVWLTGRNYSDTQNRHLEKQYTLTTTAAIEKSYDYNETLAFTIITYANRHSHALDITQAIIAYLGGTGTLTVEKSGVDYEAPYAITNYALDVREEDQGNISYYSTEVTIQLQVISDRLTDDTKQPLVQKIIIEDDEEIEQFELNTSD
jgi:hypothetical protein